MSQTILQKMGGGGLNRVRKGRKPLIESISRNQKNSSGSYRVLFFPCQVLKRGQQKTRTWRRLIICNLRIIFTKFRRLASSGTSLLSMGILLFNLNGILIKKKISRKMLSLKCSTLKDYTMYKFYCPANGFGFSVLSVFHACKIFVSGKVVEGYEITRGLGVWRVWGEGIVTTRA